MTPMREDLLKKLKAKPMSEQERQQGVIENHIKMLAEESASLKWNIGITSAIINSEIERRNKNSASLKSIDCILKTECDYDTLMKLYDTRHQVEPCKFDIEEIIDENFLLGFIKTSTNEEFISQIKEFFKKSDK